MRITSEAIDLEFLIAPILARQQAYGVLFDRQKAEKLIGDLTGRQVELASNLRDIFKPRYISLGEFMPKVSKQKYGITKGMVFTKIELEEFNPSSRTQIVDRLIKEFNWNPEEFTEKGNVKLDEDIITALPFKELHPLKEYLTIKKRLSQIEHGKQGWMRKVYPDNRIRGSVKQNGTVTGRPAYYGPNMGQVPKNESMYGKECRELFIAPKGKVIVGVDADSLEMRCLGGYLTQFDGGRFTKSIISGNKAEGTDPHSVNMYAYKLEKYESGRECAKTQFYGDLYGDKNAKKGMILLDHGISLEKYYGEGFKEDVDGMIKWVNKKNAEDLEKGKKVIERSRKYWECWTAGKKLNEAFGTQIPEIAKLRKLIKDKADENGFVKGLDGRKLFFRGEHSQLNMVLQGAGALIMKAAIAIADKDLQLAGLIPGKDYEFIIWVYDELELEVTDDKIIVDKVKTIVENSIYKAGLFFNFPAPMLGNGKVGKSWSEVH